MKVRLSRRAVFQIDSALAYVAERSPQGAANVRARLRELMALLESYPYSGRETDAPGIRRLSAYPFPYVIDYRVGTSEVIVVRFRHAARPRSIG